MVGTREGLAWAEVRAGVMDLILGFMCFLSPCLTSLQEGHCAALAKSAD